MQNTIKITTGLALMALLAGCVVTSVYPFYAAKDVVFEPALEGTWADAGTTNAEQEHWRFERAADQAYKLTVQDKEKRTEFDAHLFKLKDRLFLDLFPRERGENALPVHYLLRVARLAPVLESGLWGIQRLRRARHSRVQTVAGIRQLSFGYGAAPQ
jgi:hypothetical protein